MLLGKDGIKFLMSQNESDGALERFVVLFNRYELDAGLFECCVDARGFAWWDVARYSVQMALCVERGIIGGSQAARRSTLSRATGAIRQCGAMVVDLIRLGAIGLSSIDAVFVYGREVDSLRTDLASTIGRRLIVSNVDGGGRAGDIRVAKRSIDLFVRLSSRAIRVPTSVTEQADRIAAGIKVLFDSRVDIRALILDRYRRHLAARTLWVRVLARAKDAVLVGYVNDDTLKTLVSLASAKGISTREYQHGYMGRSHVAFSYPSLGSRLPTIPDEVVIEFDSGDIVYPTAIVLAAPAELAASATGARDIDVLVGGSPTRNADALAIVAILVDRGLSLAVKLHPAQTAEASGLRPRFESSRVMVFTGSVDFRALAARSKIYVPANPTSTTSFEAAALGARVVAVDYEGIKLTSAIDHVVAARVDAIEQLPAVIAAMLARDFT